MDTERDLFSRISSHDYEGCKSQTGRVGQQTGVQGRADVAVQV